jgi:hypothetical protein
MATTSSQPPDDSLMVEIPQSHPPSDSVSEKLQVPEPEEFKPGWRFLAAFGSLCIITLMAALDATSLPVALPVCLQIKVSILMSKFNVGFRS